MKRWTPAVHSWVPALAIVVGATLLVGFPSDGGRPAANLAVGAPSSPVTLGRYLALSRKTGSSPFTTIRALGQSGRVVAFRVGAPVNVANMRCEVRWAELAMDDLRPAAEGNWRYQDVLGWPDGLLYPKATTRDLAGELWIPEPNPLVDTGQFFMRVRLLCDGHELARDDTTTFLVNLSPLTPDASVSAPAPISRPQSIGAGGAEGTPVGESR
jgi:hypothetical protein